MTGALPIRYSLQLSTKPVTMRATTATCAGCIRHGMGQNTPFTECGSIPAAEYGPRPNILQLNTEGPTVNKISVIEQLAYKNKVFITVLQEAPCTTADKLVIPSFSLAGSVLSRNHELATFAHERSVSRTIRDWVLVHRRCRIKDH